MWFLPSFLTPTFFVLGLIAISLPILFHFFRRTPKGRISFSTLMFLKPSPPRLTSRSRVDNWILLLLRALILLLIALAFGRVFFRQSDFMNLSDLPTRRIAILVDQSASMKRGDLWKKALQQVDEVMNGLGPQDEVALYTYDSRLYPVVDFSKQSSVNTSARRELIRNSIETMTPGWHGTNLGDALLDAAERLTSHADRDQGGQAIESQIILISDIQGGSDLDSLQAVRWPEKVGVEIVPVKIAQSSNASLSLVENSKGLSGDSEFRVRVYNNPGSTKTDFQLEWLDAGLNSLSTAGRIVVPPGESRVLTVDPPAEKFSAIQLEGDDNEFDNRFYLAFPQPVPQKIMFVGGDESLRSQLRFYLRKACSSLLGKRIEFLDDSAEFDPAEKPDVVFVTGPLEASLTQVKQYVEAGGLVCLVVTDFVMANTLEGLTEQSVKISNESPDDFTLLSEIDFTHRLFKRFADPRFSNFSNIRFWNYRKVDVPGIKPIASFDTGDLAIGELPIGTGRMILMTAGWHPADSQFALSTKFVGVMMSMMLKKLERERRNFELGQSIDLQPFVGSETVSVVRPNGEKMLVPDNNKKLTENQVDRPGVYQLVSPAQSTPLAVNLGTQESLVEPMDTGLLEQAGIRLGKMATASEKVEIERQRRDTELENRQKLWRWMLMVALLALFVETALSGYYSTKRLRDDRSADSAAEGEEA